MNSELPVSADALLAERARLEEVLQSSEDWCELLRLKSRKDRGEGMSAVNAARLEMVLIDALAEDPNFIRYKAVCVALERLIRGLPPLPPKGEKPPVEKDDLTEIEGITASMQRRLNALDVTTFMQIAEWTPADIKSISSDLGIGRQIYEQDWIGQAEELATRSDTPEPAPPTPPKPSAPPKQIAPERPAAPPLPPPPPPRPVETRVAPVEKAPPPPVEREAPRPVIEAKPVDVRPAAVKAVETQPEPVATKSVPPPVAAKTEQKADDVAPEAKAPAAAAVPAIDNAKPSDPVAAKPEPKKDPKAETPPQPASEKSTSPKVETPPPAAAISSAPVTDPPRPLKPEIYRDAAAQPQMAADAASQPSSGAAARVLPMPPSPLRVQAPAAASGIATGKAPSPAAPPAELRAPPKPFVITRASLPPLPATTIAKTQPPSPPPAVQRQAEPPRTAVPPATGASAGKQDSGPFAALAALKPAAPAPSTPPAAAPSSSPSMSIAEAIAYAAEVARQSPKTTGNAPGAPANAPAAAANGTPATAVPPASQQQKLEPARPPAPAPQMPPPKPQAAPVASPPARAAQPAPAKAGPEKAAPAKPAIPPPLPEGFVPPPEEAELDQSDYSDSRGQSLRNGARDDSARKHLHAEEATVEIVVKSAPEIRPTPRATLAKVATETAASTPRPATPIGRFLKALTGN